MDACVVLYRRDSDVGKERRTTKAAVVKFSVMTFNMQFGQIWDSDSPQTAPIRLDDTIDFLLSNPHDVYLLQEVEQAQPGGEQAWPPRNFSQLEEALGGYHAVFAYPAMNPDELPFGIALAIFSRTPLFDFQSFDLPPAPVTFDFEGRERAPSHRQLIAAKTTMAGTTIQLLNTHLQAYFMIGSSSNEHPAQRNAVEGALRSVDGPAVLGGDFNCSPDENIVGQFAAAGFATAQNEDVTWRHRPYITDHLFYSSHLKVEQVGVIETICSDHHAVSANFRISRLGTL